MAQSLSDKTTEAVVRQLLADWKERKEMIRQGSCGDGDYCNGYEDMLDNCIFELSEALGLVIKC